MLLNLPQTLSLLSIVNYYNTWLPLGNDITHTDTDEDCLKAFNRFLLETVWVVLDASAGKQKLACRTFTKWLSCSSLKLCHGKHAFYSATVFSTSEFFVTSVQLRLLVAIVQSVLGRTNSVFVTNRALRNTWEQFLSTHFHGVFFMAASMLLDTWSSSSVTYRQFLLVPTAACFIIHINRIYIQLSIH